MEGGEGGGLALGKNESLLCKLKTLPKQAIEISAQVVDQKRNGTAELGTQGGQRGFETGKQASRGAEGDQHGGGAFKSSGDACCSRGL